MGASTQNNEWYTPSIYIEAARDVMHGIELDPASSEIANKTVKATRYYTKEQNGLLQEWKAESVWLNPPYGLLNPIEGLKRFKSGGSSPQKRSLQTLFVEKALHEYHAGHAKQIILLVTANTTVRWFQPLWDYPMCTPFPKIRFSVVGSSVKQSQVFGNVFVYLGPYEQRFITTFARFGTITRCVLPPVESEVA